MRRPLVQSKGAAASLRTKEAGRLRRGGERAGAADDARSMRLKLGEEEEEGEEEGGDGGERFYTE